MNKQNAPISAVLIEAVRYNGADPKRVHHLLKVHDFAAMIAAGEGLDDGTRYIIEVAAALHDIGIHEAERIHGSCEGCYQEQEGPAVASAILRQLDVSPAVVERVCWLIAHHHTYHPIDGIDHQILLEADFLVNAYEDNSPARAIAACRERVFHTETGLLLLDSLYPAQS